jgi:hypothetical protein
MDFYDIMTPIYGFIFWGWIIVNSIRFILWVIMGFLGYNK